LVSETGSDAYIAYDRVVSADETWDQSRTGACSAEEYPDGSLPDLPRVEVEASQAPAIAQ